MSKFALTIGIIILSGCRSGGSGLTNIFDKDGKKLPTTEENINSNHTNWELLSETKDSQYSGIGHFSPGGCTGFFIDPDKGATKVPSYFITSAHCAFAVKTVKVGNRSSSERTPDGWVGIFDRNDFVASVGSSNVALSVPFFKDNSNKPFALEGGRLEYASYTGTDIAIFSQFRTIENLKSLGINPVKLSKIPAKLNEPMEVIGIPIDAIDHKTQEWISINSENQYLHRSKCTVNKLVPLLREFRYDLFNAVRNQCSQINGHSGSPYIRIENGVPRVFAIASTVVEDFKQDAPCAADIPCEVEQGKTSVAANQNYGVDITMLNDCFHNDGRFDFKRNGCKLYKGLAEQKLADIEKPKDFDEDEKEEIGTLKDWIRVLSK